MTRLQQSVGIEPVGCEQLVGSLQCGGEVRCALGHHDVRSLVSKPAVHGPMADRSDVGLARLLSEHFLREDDKGLAVPLELVRNALKLVPGLFFRQVRGRLHLDPNGLAGVEGDLQIRGVPADAIAIGVGDRRGLLSVADYFGRCLHQVDSIEFKQALVVDHSSVFPARKLAAHDPARRADDLAGPAMGVASRMSPVPAAAPQIRGHRLSLPRRGQRCAFRHGDDSWICLFLGVAMPAPGHIADEKQGVWRGAGLTLRGSVRDTDGATRGID